MKTKLFATVAAAALLAAGSASADTMVVAGTDLNVRAGPGPQYEVTGVIGVDEQATMLGCVEGGNWCQITYAGGEGWAYSAYLIAEYDGTEIVVTERPAEVEIPVVEYRGPSAEGALTGGATGAVAGALIGGPVGAAVGAVAGVATVGVAEGVLSADARTYVLENPVEPVYLEGEVVVGAQVPEAVEVREIPNYEYRYVYVNHQPVIVEPDTRRIVYIVR